MLALAAAFGLFGACSDGGSSGGSDPVTYTVTFYGDTTSTTPRTATIESGAILSGALATAPDGYSFKAWLSADGTDYTQKGITADVTLFAVFVKQTVETSEDKTLTTTTTSEKSVETDKTTVEEENSATNVTVTTVEETVTKIGSTQTTVTESTTTKNADGTTTSESTVTTTDSEGNTISIVETVIADDGTKP